MMKKSRLFYIDYEDDLYKVGFEAMASDCEILIQTNDKAMASQLAQIICDEVWRIEDKYSRYKPNNVCSQFNASEGEEIAIDEETYLLLNFADHCYTLSEGLFDITSGVLRKAWPFEYKQTHQINNASIHTKSNGTNSSTNLPTESEIHSLLQFVGWHKLKYNKTSITIPKGMQLDFGGIGKEYAVDRAVILAKNMMLTSNISAPLLVNLGGDLAVSQPRNNNEPWQVAIENTSNENTLENKMIVALKQGALATSGDTKRFFIKDGIRYGHILNATTGKPVNLAPHSITVAAPKCIQAGILATIALMQGKEAEQFLLDTEVAHWIRR